MPNMFNGYLALIFLAGCSDEVRLSALNNASIPSAQATSDKNEGVGPTVLGIELVGAKDKYITGDEIGFRVSLSAQIGFTAFGLLDADGASGIVVMFTLNGEEKQAPCIVDSADRSKIQCNYKIRENDPTGKIVCRSILIHAGKSGTIETKFQTEKAASFEVKIEQILETAAPAVIKSVASIAIYEGNEQSGLVGHALTKAFAVIAKDADGNPVPGISVSWSVAQGHGTLSSNAVTLTKSNGVATGPSLTLSVTPGEHKVTASISSGNIRNAIFTATALADSVDSITINGGNNPSGTVGSTITTPFAVVLKDSHGNLISGARVSWSVAQGEGSFAGDSTTLSGSDGVAKSPAFTLGTVAMTNSVLATIASKSVTFNASAIEGPAHHLSFVSAPSNAVANGTIPQVQVKVVDAYGNTISNATNSITLSLNSSLIPSPGTATLAGGGATAAVNGVASFPSLKIDQVGIFSLTANATGLTGISSSSFKITGNLVVSGPSSIIHTSCAKFRAVLKDGSSKLVKPSSGFVLSMASTNHSLVKSTTNVEGCSAPASGASDAISTLANRYVTDFYVNPSILDSSDTLSVSSDLSNATSISYSITTPAAAGGTAARTFVYDLSAIFGGNPHDNPGAFDVTPTGQLYIAGSIIQYAGSLAKFTAAGALDASFGTSGAMMPNYAGYYSASFVSVQPDGKVIAIKGSEPLPIRRYNADGSGEFNFDATLTANVYMSGALSAPDGKLYACVAPGTTSWADSGTPSVIRFNEDGSLDTTFNATGQVSIAQLRAASSVQCLIALQADGKIIIGGPFVYYTVSGGQQIYDSITSTENTSVPGLVRLNSDGSTDSSFGTNGFTSFPKTYGSFSVYGIKVLASGKILLGGITASAYAFAQFTSSGALDASFGAGGTPGFGEGGSNTGGGAHPFSLQPDGKILIGGWYNFARFTANGVIDTSFNTTGMVTPASSCWAPIVAPDGTIVCTGYQVNAVSGSSGNDTDLGWYYP